ncbi:MAG: ATP-binding cassette domain-containing protein, partial [Muribaculaceae bacterium]|nr:ATP-binding cassette domain-containing protein [Muribaculaceae bacterium]
MPISYLQIENLTKSVGDRMLFVDVTFGVNEGDKIGIVAKNGTGKTSLLRIIAGVDAPDSGTVTPRAGLRIAILEQVPQFEPEETVIEACLKGDNETARTVRDYELAMQRGDYETTSALSAKMDALGSWDYEDRARQMLTQCSITDFEAKVKTLSGGQRKRIALCRILIEQPDMLILDEPTNHLDIATIEWLEAYLSRSRMTLL